MAAPATRFVGLATPTGARGAPCVDCAAARLMLRRMTQFRASAAASLLLLLAGCAAEGTAPVQAVPQAEAEWRGVATNADRGRIRQWRDAWLEALQRARAAGHGAEIDAEGALLVPDAALLAVSPPAGEYRCRVTKLGAKSEGLL